MKDYGVDGLVTTDEYKYKDKDGNEHTVKETTVKPSKSGAMAGTAAGAIVAGPVGAVVGGFIGLIWGSAD
jgi:hypothetical protein